MDAQPATLLDSQAQLQLLTDRAELAELPFRIAACLDEHRFADLGAYYAEDAAGSTPGGAVEGRDALVDLARTNHQDFDRIHHRITNVVVDFDGGDEASVRTNVIGTFGLDADPVPTRVAHARYRLRFRRTGEGWRVVHMEVEAVFRDERRLAQAAA